MILITTTQGTVCLRKPRASGDDPATGRPERVLTE